MYRYRTVHLWESSDRCSGVLIFTKLPRYFLSNVKLGLIHIIGFMAIQLMRLYTGISETKGSLTELRAWQVLSGMITRTSKLGSHSEWIQSKATVQLIEHWENLMSLIIYFSLQHLFRKSIEEVRSFIGSMRSSSKLVPTLDNTQHRYPET
jgi:hypothetical protein